MPQTPKYFLSRAKIYSDEMFPVLIYLPYLLALYICLNFASQVLSGPEIIVDQYAIAGMASGFFFMLLMRTFDDLKDIEIDKDLFPERATPRKAVLKSDIQKISLFSFLCLILINVFFSRTTLIPFAITLTYCVLTFKWFFLEKLHRRKVFLTMVTHQPIPYAINTFLIFTALAAGGINNAFTFNHFLLLLMFSLPVTGWEVSRKIRSADMETDYETFSMIFGARGAAFIPFTALILAGLISLYLGKVIDLQLSFYVINLLLILFIGFFYIRFIVQPTNKNNVLKNITMIYTSLLFFNFLIHLLMIYNVVNGL